MTWTELNRRHFITTLVGAGGALVLGVSCSRGSEAEVAKIPSADGEFVPSVFVSIDASGEVTITVGRSEMGQGVRTSMPMLVAEELEVPWESVRIVQADGHEKYGNQNTDGSRSVRTQYLPLRRAGAAARMMLVAAAAKAWGVEPSSCQAVDGRITHPESGLESSYGDLVELAAREKVPKKITLKDPKNFRLIGTERASFDLDDIVRGAALYGADTPVEGIAYGVLLRCPVKGGKLRSLNKKAALAVPGVLQVETIDATGPPANTFESVVVVAESTWQALQGREALEAEWDLGSEEKWDTANLTDQLKKSVGESGETFRDEGDAEKVLGEAKTLRREFDAPYLVHSPMEPMTCTVRLEEGYCEIWTSTQAPQWARKEAAGVLGLEPSSVTVHVSLLGGGFGRKSKPDFVVEAVLAAKAVGRPLRVQWSRDDEIRFGYYRPQSRQRLDVALDGAGRPKAWRHRSAFPTISSTFAPGSDRPKAWEMAQGATTLPYRIPAIRVEAGRATSPLRIGWLRSVHHLFHAWSVNCVLDELAQRAGVDPMDYHLELLGEARKIPSGDPAHPFDTGRLAAVIRQVRTLSRWDQRKKDGRHLGFAVHGSFYSYVAMVAEVVIEGRNLRVRHVDAVVDCGRIINPDGVRAQIEGSVAMGLTAALLGEITVKGGRVEQSNFPDCPLLRNSAMPTVKVGLVPSEATPSGIGEPGTPPVAPALFNAVAAAKGKRYFSMPLSLPPVNI